MGGGLGRPDKKYRGVWGVVWWRGAGFAPLCLVLLELADPIAPFAEVLGILSRVETRRRSSTSTTLCFFTEGGSCSLGGFKRSSVGGGYGAFRDAWCGVVLVYAG